MLCETDILFCDNHLLAVNKPAGLVTQPSGGQADSLEGQAKEWVKQAFGKPGNVFLEAVHRIDRPVSGVVLFARTSKALSRLGAAVRERRVEKVYWAVVHGAHAAAVGTLEHWLVHESHHARVVPAGTPGAKPARMTCRLQSVRGDLAWLEIDLETGRYHQIRAQLAAVGCVIVGDRRYGAAEGLPQQAIALHHCRLTVPHPVGGNAIRIAALPPECEPWTRFPVFLEPRACPSVGTRGQAGGASGAPTAP